jgi:hypothetical protein
MSNGYWRNADGARIDAGGQFTFLQTYKQALDPVVVTIPETGETVEVRPARVVDVTDRFTGVAPGPDAAGKKHMAALGYEWVKVAPAPDASLYDFEPGEIVNGVQQWKATPKDIEGLRNGIIASLKVEEETRIARVASLQEQVHNLARYVEIKEKAEADRDDDDRADEEEINSMYVRIAAISQHADYLRSIVKSATSVEDIKAFNNMKRDWPDGD